jgi:6-phosphogluconolactonase (cycloisomerase 2 family)
VQNHSSRTRVAISIGLTGALLLTIGCGGRTTPTTPPNTYLYVGGANNPFLDPPGTLVTGSIFQLRVESDGTLTAINTSTTGPNLRAFTTTVSPGNQYLLASDDLMTEFAIGGDGTLQAPTSLGETGFAVAFAPNGQFAFLTNVINNTLDSYELSASGTLTPISTVATGWYPQFVVVDGSGRFAYTANENDDTISEYTVSAGGVLTVNGSAPSGGYTPNVLAISPAGFLYCGNANSGSLSTFSIDASTGALALVDNFVMPQGLGGAMWISFNPAGTYAYVGNLFEIAQFTVDGTTGILTSNGTTPMTSGANWGGLDPSGKFFFTANGDGTVSQFAVSSTGTLIPNGSVSVGADMVATILTFAQR